MLKIQSVFSHILNGLIEGNDRYTFKDDEHVMDSKTGVELHVYDDWFKLTYDGRIIAKMSDFTRQEQDVVWSIKQAITKPELIQQKKDQYQELLKARRIELSDLFESPRPIANKDPVTEEGAVDYSG